MAKTGPIVIVDDDPEDQEIFQLALQSIGADNPVRFFENGKKALEYLYNTDEQPFLIISDMNIPLMNGLELRAAIQNDEVLRAKAVPFIFMSTDASPIAVRKAYELTIQGFFQKPSSINELEHMLKQIFNYWRLCKHPNNV